MHMLRPAVTATVPSTCLPVQHCGQRRNAQALSSRVQFGPFESSRYLSLRMPATLARARR